MTARIRVKVRRVSAIRTKINAPFPARVLGDVFITITKANGTYTISPDYSPLFEPPSFDPSAEYVAVQNIATGEWNRLSIATLVNNTQATVRVVTEAGDIVVGAATQLLIMNRTVNQSPSNIILPASAQKVGKVKIVDFKGNAGTYPHTITAQGSDTFQGGLTTWTLGGDGSSVALDPIPGIGYAV